MTKRTYTRRTPDQWQHHITEQEQSDLSIADYCTQHQLATSNFYTWRSRLSGTRAEAQKTSIQADDDWLPLPTGLPASPVTSTKSMVIRMSLPGGITLTLTPA